MSGSSPQTAQIDSVFGKAFSVLVSDASGNPVANAAVTFTAPALGTNVATGTFSGGAGTSTATTGANGIAISTSAFTAGSVAGSYSVTATSGGATAAVFNLTNTAGAPATIVANAGAGETTAIDTAFATPLAALVRDSGGNPVSGVSVTFTSPTGGAGAQFAGAASITAQSNGNGIAVSGSLLANSVAGSYSVTASAAGTSGAAFALSNTPGSTASITASGGKGQSTPVATSFGTPFSATVKDAGGNLVPGVIVTFTAPATGAGGSFAGGVNTAVTSATGVATAPGFNANTVSGTYTVLATSGNASATFTATNTPGAAAAVKASGGTPQSTAVNGNFAALTAAVTDSYGNPVPNVTVTFTAPASGASANFAGSGVTAGAVSNAAGIATPAQLTANATPGGPYTIAATVTGATGAGYTLTNNAATVGSIVASGGTPQTTSVGTMFGNAFQATVEDGNGNPLPDVTVTFTAPAVSGSAAGGVFTSGAVTATALTGSTGEAISPEFVANANSGTYTVTAAAGGTATARYTLTNAATGNAEVTATDAARFLEQASWGPTPASVAHLQQVGFDAWLNEQFAAPASTYPDPDPSVTSDTALQQQFFANALNGVDQLRQRVSFALSQVFVISGSKIVPQGIAPYLRLLQADAFGNFYDLMQDVTLSPAMGHYLDMVNNNKANAAAGTKANENYAREFMQLFTIGLEELNPDGSLQLDGSGNPIPTYNQNTVDGNAAVLTGWTYPPTPGIAPASHNPTYWLGPMVAVQANHDTTAKTILNGVTIPAGGTAQADLTIFLQTVFNHPNLGPFFCKQLIQHLVTSNPSPAYVARVAAVFNNDGTGTRGNLQAVITAILEDSEARQDAPTANPNFGHLREPALYIATLLRELGAVSDGAGLANYASGMGQNLFNAGSVFNYFPPNYPVPGTTLVGAEFDIETTATTIARANFANTLVFGALGATTTVNWNAWNSLASQANVTALMNQLDTLLTHGEMPAQLKSSVATAVAVIPASTPATRVENAVYLIATSSAFKVQY